MLTTAARGALDGSAVAANASRRRLINQAWLEQLEAVTQNEAQGEEPGAVPGWMANTAKDRAHQHEHGQAQEQLAKRQAPDKILVSPGDPEVSLLKSDG